ncbi:MAG TPA: Gfo/Idh/MocA family oxidoreductase [Nitrososphaerales archaeon]|nr:Gfo/Idh/MocA family oxidoreductase [Nitrososphaerales archaeon]
MSYKIVRIGLIGCGFMAGEHLRHLQLLDDCKLVSVSDVDPSAIERLKKIAPWIDGVDEFKDYRDMIAAGGLDAVIVATPHSLHHEQALFALHNNLDALIEKPMVSRAAEAREIAHLAKEKKKLVMVGYQRHTEPPYAHARQIIASGELGKLHYVNAIQTQGWFRDKLGTWRTDPRFNELGYIADSGSHLIDAIQWISGSEVEEVIARTDNLSSEVPVNAAIFLRYSSGALASISMVGSAPEWHEQVRFYGELGEIICRFNYDEHYQAANSSVEIIDQNNYSIQRPLRMLPPRSNPTRNFINSLLGTEEPLCTVEDGMMTAVILEAIQASAKDGGKPVMMSMKKS